MGKKKKTATSDLNNLTDGEVLLMLARESLARYGTALPPGLGERGAIPLPTTAPVERHQGKAADAEFKDVKKLCPKCGKTKKVLPDFGLVTKRGIRRPQGWCRQCRNETHYYDKPRKNNVRDAKPR